MDAAQPSPSGCLALHGLDESRLAALAKPSSPLVNAFLAAGDAAEMRLRLEQRCGSHGSNGAAGRPYATLAHNRGAGPARG
jgi:hypothetical protein